MLVDWGLVRIMDLTATRLRACVYGTLMSTFFSPFAGLDFGAPEHDDRGAHGICLPSAFVIKHTICCIRACVDTHSLPYAPA
jgi:hypothetical protein